MTLKRFSRIIFVSFVASICQACCYGFGLYTQGLFGFMGVIQDVLLAIFFVANETIFAVITAFFQLNL